MKLKVDFIKHKNGRYAVWVLGDGEDLAQSDSLPDEIQCWVYLEHFKSQLKTPIESVEIKFKNEDLISSLKPFGRTGILGNSIHIHGNIDITGHPIELLVFQNTKNKLTKVEAKRFTNYTVEALNHFDDLRQLSEELVQVLNTEETTPKEIADAQHKLEDLLGEIGE